MKEIISQETILDLLRQIFDPEIPVNIYDLGLIYEVMVSGPNVRIRMSLTSRHCPAAQSLPATVKQAIERLPGVAGAIVEVVWDPPWSREMISEEGRKILGI